jgi:DNA-binding Xre family transcriptional regulator
MYNTRKKTTFRAVCNMGMAIKIRTLLLERNMKIKDLAEKLGYSGNNLSNKLKNDNFSDKELRQIAEILNCDYEASFIMRDTGKII